MPKYLLKATYTADGTRGLIKEGGSKRRAAVQKLVEGVGGKLETFYYAYGPDDAFIIADLPDATSGLALCTSKIPASPLPSPPPSPLPSPPPSHQPMVVSLSCVPV